jgi:hypothetical protein
VSESNHLGDGGCGARVPRDALIGALLGALSSVGMAPAAAQQAPEQATSATSASTSVPADAQNASPTAGSDNVPLPSSTEQGRTTMDESFEPLTHAQWVAATKRRAFRDTKFYGQLRSFYFASNNLNSSQSEASSLGGSAGFKTG